MIRIVKSQGIRKRQEPMLFIAGLLVLSVAVVVLRRRQSAGGADAAPFGLMSEQWLAEHRSSHSL